MHCDNIIFAIYNYLYTDDSFDLQGVNVCSEKMLTVTTSAQSLYWEEYGLKLHVREHSLPEGMEQCTILIKASTTGQYKLPENFYPVSAFFWFISQPVCKFTKSITMEMEHCAKLENAAKLTFMRALCTQERLPYVFEKTGGHFSSDSHYGTIELNGFSGKVISQEGSSVEFDVQRQYGARIFNIIKTITCYDIEFVVTWNTKAHLSVGVGHCC